MFDFFFFAELSISCRNKLAPFSEMVRLALIMLSAYLRKEKVVLYASLGIMVSAVF
jgi:hypothetical protein